MVTYAYPPPKLSPATSTAASSFLRTIILFLIAGAAVASREFAVVRFESIIHEFDPWFNFRATKVLAKDGFYEFWNWFDPTAWYPLGRVVGGTLYPGLMVTSGLIWKALQTINIPVDIREVCVQLAPAFSGLTAFATYLFAKEVGKDGSREGTGLWAALFIGIAPGYISRSVAGSYDNEAIAIFILMMTFYLWIRAVKQGSALWGGVTALFYFYMVAAWGGYAFITNMLPLHVFVLILMGRYSSRLYVAYSSFYAIGTLASMQVPFVGFLPLLTSEHMSSLGVFGLLQIVAFVSLVQSHVPPKQFKVLLNGFIAFGLTVAVAGLLFMTKSGKIAPWTGRFYSLWDTGYARIHLPLVSSVSEHQPTAWPSFFFDLQMLIYLFPAGVYMCFRELRDEHVFVIIYAVLASYFAGVMVRLMLTLTPVVCVAAAVAVSSIYETYLDPVEPDRVTPIDESTLGSDSLDAPASPTPGGTPSKKSKKAAAAAAAAVEATGSGATLAPTPTPAAAPRAKKAKATGAGKFVPGIYGLDTRLAPVLTFTMLLLIFVLHCTWVTSTAYSSPSVVLASRNQDGSQAIIDDFREAYYWLRQNTKEDAKIMSWWDYGYQIAGFADRTTLVDNNTWNNTHIAMVGKTMSVREEVAYPILRKHDVDYVLIIFGGLLGFSGDDLNKFLWMVRISEGIWPEEVNEQKFFTSRGEYKVDGDATETMKNSLMYKMSYYRFAELYGGGPAQDRVRQQTIPNLSPTLDTLDEAFTSENWIVRIYEVKKEDILGRDHKAANLFSGGKRKKRTKTAKKAAAQQLFSASRPGPHRRAGVTGAGATAGEDGSEDKPDHRPSQLGPDKDADDVNGQEPDRRWPRGFTSELKHRVLLFSPAWFSCNMAVGMVSILICDLPYQFYGLKAISLAVFLLNLVLFLVFCIAFIARLTIWRGVWTSMITHPVQSFYIGTFPMGLSTLGDMVVLAVVPAFPNAAGLINFAWALFWIQGGLAFLVATYVPYVMFTRQKHIDPAAVSLVWMLPIVAPVIGAAAGSTVAMILPLAQARITVVVCYLMLGISLPPMFFVLTLFFHRMVVYKLPSRETIVSLFLAVGPCGQTSFCLLQLAIVLRERPEMFANTLLYDSAFAEIVGVISTIFALWFWGLGLFWLSIAGTGVIAAARSGGVPFNLGWFAFIFPIGTMSTSALLLSKALQMPAFRVISMALAVFDIFLFVLVAGRTAAGVWSGTIFVAPDVGYQEPEMRWTASKAAKPLHDDWDGVEIA